MSTQGVKQAATKTTANIWARMPLWAKGLVLAGVAYGGYKLFKGTIGSTRIVGGQVRDSSQELDGWNQDFAKDDAEQKATLTKASMKAMANSIFRAMDGYGTDEDSILSSIKKVKNNADWSGLQVAWGKRTISSGAYNPAPNLTNATLGEAITDELSDYWKKEFNKHLSKQGIKYKVY
jgi:hypothetical protein